MSNALTESQFLKEVQDHKMTVIKDDGVHRHIRFAKPGTSCMHFDLTTWPGYLCYSGDMGTYVFSRLRDMFEFFRTDREYAQRRGMKLAINRSYWAEKLQAIDRDGVKKFDEEKFNANVLRYLKGWLRDHRDATTKEERRELWDEVMFDVIGADGDGGGYRKQCAAHDFSHKVNANVREFSFQDFYEYDCESYTHRFDWCCYALAWGIQQYDDAKAPVELGATT